MTFDHRTYHAAEAVDGKVWVGCSCGWTDAVEVSPRESWLAAMERIYEVRDAHAAEALLAPAEGADKP